MTVEPATHTSDPVQVHPARPWILPTEPTRRSDLIRLGITSRMIRTGLAMGTLVRVRQGVVVATEFWPTDPAGQHLVRARAELAANECQT